MNAREKLLQNRQRIHDAIRQAAIEEFALHGPTGASTQGIAKRAGLTKPQLHYYISSKDELYEEILAFIVAQWTEIFALSATSDQPETVIRSYIRRKIEYSRRNPEITRVFSNEIARGAPVLRKYWHNALASAQRSSALFQSWMDRGLIRKIDPMLLQMHMWAVTQHYADYDAQVRLMLGVGETGDIDEEYVIEEVSALFLRYCGL